MAIVLAALGVFLYTTLSRDLDQTIDEGLRSRVGDVRAAARAAEGDPIEIGRRSTIDQTEGFTQILDVHGRVLSGTPRLHGHRLINLAELRAARKHSVLAEVDLPPPRGGRARIIATPLATSRTRRDVLIVGALLDDRHESLRRLLGLILLGFPIALLMVAGIGYFAITAALRPVNRMTRRAAAISGETQGQRLPLPATRDEIHELGDTLNDMLERLEAAFEHERRFVADASHELRTPLTVLKSELELALRSGRSAEELHAALTSASEETDRVVQLAEDLLVIARSDEGALVVHPQAVDATELLDAARSRFAGRADERGRSIELDARDLVFEADPVRIEQALGNLVDNALRHGDGTVRLSARSLNGDVEIAVEDDGQGFPPEFRDRAFERFARADVARSRAGAGLGLAIVQAILRAHGGSAEVTQRDGGRGARVVLRLPQQG
jgi:heavy metal sensor kinase